MTHLMPYGYVLFTYEFLACMIASCSHKNDKVEFQLKLKRFSF